MKICLSSAKGGHLEQLLKLDYLKKSFPIFYLLPNRDGVPKINKRKTYKIQPYPRNSGISYPFIVIINAYQSLKIFFKEKPSLFITTGGNEGIFLALIMKLFNKRIINIESFSRITFPSLSGRFFHMFADLTIVQWPSMKKFYPGSVFGGPIFDFSQSKELNKISTGKIFLTLGTRQEPFLRPLKEVEKLIKEGVINRPVIAQVGRTKYTPSNFSTFDFCSVSDFEKHIKESDLIITHSGAGTIIKCTISQKKVVVIPRDPNLGECQDNHQYQIAEQFEKLGLVLVSKESNSLKDKIKMAEDFKPSIFQGESRIKDIIDEKINLWFRNEEIQV